VHQRLARELKRVALIAGVRSRSHPVTCTPRYKYDADRPWITQEGVGIISLSLHPNSEMTLEDVARLVENFASGQVADQLALQPMATQAANVRFHGTICNMTFRRETIQRAQMLKYRAVDYIQDGEPFNLLYKFTTTSTVKPWILFCPCCFLCFSLHQSSAETETQAPNAQQMYQT